MTDVRDPIENAALAWLLRINDSQFVDWDDWHAWLAEDDRHGEVYWRLAEDEAEIVATLAQAHATPEVIVAPVVPARRSGRQARTSANRTQPRRWVVGFGIAATIVAAVGIGWFLNSGERVIETGAGEQRTLTLADGSRLHLAGATRLTVDRDNPRAVRLEAGRAIFEVAHDEARPFTVSAGTATVTDLGTVFDVTRLDGGVRVAVSDGVVRFDQAGQSETLKVGEGLTAINGRLTRRAVDVETVQGWRGGRLAYERETLSVVAQDLTRGTGRTITVNPALAGRSFSGVLSLSGPDEALRNRLALLLDVAVIQDGDAWRLEPRRER